MERVLNMFNLSFKNGRLRVQSIPDLSDRLYQYQSSISRYASESGQPTNFFAAVACCRRRGGQGSRWLLGLAKTTDDRNNRWVFPGGGIKANESPEEAACRECFEETGVKCHTIGRAFERADRPGVAFVECIADSYELKGNHEFIALGWFNENNFSSLRLFYNVRGLVDALGAKKKTVSYAANAANGFHEDIKPTAQINEPTSLKLTSQRFKVDRYEGKLRIQYCCPKCREGKPHECECEKKRKQMPAPSPIEKRIEYQLSNYGKLAKRLFYANTENCGTGAGGFQRDNECAAGGKGGGEQSKKDYPKSKLVKLKSSPMASNWNYRDKKGGYDYWSTRNGKTFAKDAEGNWYQLIIDKEKKSKKEQTAPPANVESKNKSIREAMSRVEPQALTQGALVSIRKLRVQLGNPPWFDQEIFRLAGEGVLALHEHDYPHSLSEQEKKEMIHEGNRYFIGVALREGK